MAYLTVGPSIPFGNFANRNASKAGVIVMYPNRDLLIGFYRKISAFAVTGWHTDLNLDLLFKNNVGISLSGSRHQLSTNFTNLKMYFIEIIGTLTTLVSITQPDFVFYFYNVRPYYWLKYKDFVTQIGPQVGLSITQFPNFERIYKNVSNNDYLNITHRTNEKDISSLMYGLQISQIYLINKNLNVGLNIGLCFSSFDYRIAPRAIGSDPLGPYDDTLQAKILSIGIRTGFWF